MRVTGRIDIDAPRGKVWEVISDPSCYPTFMSGVLRWEPGGGPESGVGARFIVRLQVGSAPLGALIEVVESEEPCDLAWTSVTGLDHRGRWRLRDAGPDRTRVSLRIAYQAPGGVLGLVADRVAAPMLQRIVDESLVALKAQIEGKSPRLPARPWDMLAEGARAAITLVRAGVLRPMPPTRLVGVLDALRRWGANPAAAVVVGAIRAPDAPVVIDERGATTYRELDHRTNSIARGLQARGVEAGTNVGVMCRNHAGFVEASVAAAKLGANLVYLNTGFSGPQVADVCDHEGVSVLVHDEEFADVCRQAEVPVIFAWSDGNPAGDTLDDLANDHPAEPHDPPSRPGRVVILTSGTTGRPKGAPRSQPDDIGPAVALLSRIPYREGDTTVISAPMFHAWGYAHLVMGLALSSTLILRRRFDAADVLRCIERHRATVLVAVPVMLRRMLDLPPEERKADTSSLRVVAVSGSALPGQLAMDFMDEFGDVLYNLYGSTEVAWATVADPGQLRACPTTSGTPPPGTTVKILDDRGVEQPRGRRGRIFVGNGMGFSGYTGGGRKAVVRGLIDTGDMGHIDPAGRLMVEGRSDDMIVSGGENVFPQEVEELLAAHPDVADVAVTGVDDEKRGQRLAAYVVPRPGAKLTVDDVKRHVRAHLANYKVPRDVELRAELPRNDTGKVLKRELTAKG